MVSDKVEESLKHVFIQVEQMQKSLELIVAKTGDVNSLVNEITAASREQSQGIEQVNIAVSQMDKLTQTNAASAEEGASASEELNAQAISLREAVTDLLALVGGKTGDAAPPRMSLPNRSILSLRHPGKTLSPCGHNREHMGSPRSSGT